MSNKEDIKDGAILDPKKEKEPNETLLKNINEALNRNTIEAVEPSTEIRILKDVQSSKYTGDEKATEVEKNKNTDTREDSDTEVFKRFLNIALIVFVIVLIIITVGWFFSKLNKTDYEEAVVVEDEDELEIKKQRLKEVEDKIASLELKKVQIQKTEKRYLITARVVIGVGMLLINAWFANKYIYFNDTFELNKILSFNSAILLCYSFVAFMLYGTPANFVAALKNIISNFLKNKHVDTLTELEKLIKERDTLFKEIEVLERK